MPDTRPERMLRAGRPADPHFTRDERLFRRCSFENVAGDVILPTAFRFPNFSVNREKYSVAEDVLLEGPQGSGIVAFPVRAVPSKLATESGVYSFGIEHVPEDLNFAHSEVRCVKGDRYDASLFNPRLKVTSIKVKKAFRQAISDAAAVILRPSKVVVP